MGRGYGFLRRAAVLLTCVSLVVYPCRIHAGPFMQIEVDDTEDFGTGMKRFLGGEGFEGSQMQQFLKAPKREWSDILDRFAGQFGFSPRFISMQVILKLIFPHQTPTGCASCNMAII